jgi:hypothetical protein
MIGLAAGPFAARKRQTHAVSRTIARPTIHDVREPGADG